jgi:Ca2+-binding EF-hand superfamily protein
MAKQGRMIDLFREWDTNGDGRVDREEMLAALTAEGVLDR